MEEKEMTNLVVVVMMKLVEKETMVMIMEEVEMDLGLLVFELVVEVD